MLGFSTEYLQASNNNLNLNKNPSQSPPSKRKRAKKAFTFYAWLNERGELDYQTASSNGYAYIPAEGKSISAIETADWYTPATFKKAWTYEIRKNGRKSRKLLRTKENIRSLRGSFVDIDGDGSITLSSDVILQRCVAYGIPLPTYILRTSPNHYQCFWEYIKEVLNNKRSIMSYWETVQGGMHEAFKDLGADPNAKDACRYLRSPQKPNAVNTKYPNKPLIELEYVGEKVSLKSLYAPLKKAGFIKLQGLSKQNRRKGDIPSRVSKRKLIRFLKENPNWEGTYQELFKSLGIPERSGYRIVGWFKESGWLKVEKVRVGRTWKTRFSSNFDTANISKTNFLNSNSGNSFNFYCELLIRFAREGLMCGYRNEGVFLFALWLKLRGRSFSDVLKFLEGGFLKSRDNGTHRFGEREFERTVRNAFKDRYKFWHSLKSERFQKIVVALGLFDLAVESQKTI